MYTFYTIFILLTTFKIYNILRVSNLTLKFQNDILHLRGKLNSCFLENDLKNTDFDAFQHLYNNVYQAERVLVNTNIWLMFYKSIRHKNVIIENRDRILAIEKLIDQSIFKPYYQDYLQITVNYLKQKARYSIGSIIGILYLKEKIKVFFTKSVTIVTLNNFVQAAKDLATSLEFRQKNLPFNRNDLLLARLSDLPKSEHSELYTFL